MGSCWRGPLLLLAALAFLGPAATTTILNDLDEDDDLIPSFAVEEENQAEFAKSRSGPAAAFHRSNKVTGAGRGKPGK